MKTNHMSIIEFERRLPNGWKVGSILTDNKEYIIMLYQPVAKPSSDSLKQGRGLSLETAFVEALKQIIN